MTYKNQQQETTIRYGNIYLILDFRRLWQDLAMWNSNYVTSIMADYGDATATGERLYSVPLEFGNRIRMIFGDQAADTIINLLSQHIILMMTMATAIKNGDQETVSSNTAQLYANADELAAYLDQINAFWDDRQWRYLLYNYIRLNLNRMVALAEGDFEESVKINDRLTYQALQMADYMSNGIIQYLHILNTPPVS